MFCADCFCGSGHFGDDVKTMTREKIAKKVDAWMNDTRNASRIASVYVTAEQLTEDMYRAHVDGVRKHNAHLFTMCEFNVRAWCKRLGVTPKPYTRSSKNEKSRKYKADQQLRREEHNDSVAGTLRLFNQIFNSGEKRMLTWR